MEWRRQERKEEEKREVKWKGGEERRKGDDVDAEEE